jgi:hypothetical protein
MRAILWLLVIVVLVGIAAIWFGFINVSQTSPGALPKVAVTGGKAPTFDVQTANVSVHNETETVTVPHVDVQKPK